MAVGNKYKSRSIFRKLATRTNILKPSFIKLNPIRLPFTQRIDVNKRNKELLLRRNQGYDFTKGIPKVDFLSEE